MNEPETLPAPVLAIPPKPRNKFEREHEAFQHLRPQLLEAYRDKYVAIHEGQVVDSGDDEIALAERVYARLGYVPIFIDLVTDSPRAPVRIGSPRIVQNGREA